MGPSGPLVPFVPDPLDLAQLEGATVDGWTQYAGTYGMGARGFLGGSSESTGETRRQSLLNMPNRVQRIHNALADVGPNPQTDLGARQSPD